MKNVTFSIPDDLLERVRVSARRHGTNLNALVCDLLLNHVTQYEGDPVIELKALRPQLSIKTKGRKLSREDYY